MNCYYKGLLKSKGDYLFFLDSDDFFKKEKLKIIINEFIINKKLNVLFDLPIWKYNLKLVKKNLDKKNLFYQIGQDLAPKVVFVWREDLQKNYLHILI